MRAGPKGLITAPPLDLRRYPRRGGARAVRFIQRYVTVPKGTEARRPLRLRPWQREIITGVLDEPRPRQALVSIPAGNGKSTLAAALGLYGLLADGMEGAQVLVVASDERQARIIYNTAARMVELSHDGDSRLARHVANVILKADSRGARLAKEHKDSTRRIDAAVCMVMAVHRAAELADSTPAIYA